MNVIRKLQERNLTFKLTFKDKFERMHKKEVNGYIIFSRRDWEELLFKLTFKR